MPTFLSDLKLRFSSLQRYKYIRIILFAFFLLLTVLLVVQVLQIQDSRNRASGPVTSPQVAKYPIDWTANKVFVRANDFYVIANGKKFVPNSSLRIVSSGVTLYTPQSGGGHLDVEWTQDGVTMGIYFNLILSNGEWGVDSFRTNDGTSSGSKIYYNGFAGGALGQVFERAIFDLNSSSSNPAGVSGSVHFENLIMSAFIDENLLPTNVPTPTIVQDKGYITGKIVDSNGVLLYIPGQMVTVSNETTGLIRVASGSSGFVFNDLPAGMYNVEASSVPGYTIEHKVCFGCMDEDKFFLGGTFGVQVSSSRYVGVTLKYSGHPVTPTLAPTSAPSGGGNGGGGSNPGGGGSNPGGGGSIPQGGGLSATYYNNVNFTAPAVSRRDSSISFNWGLGSPDPSVQADTFSVRWNGSVEIPQNGTYTFYFWSDDGARVYVNNRLVVNRSGRGGREGRGSLTLNKGRYPIRIEYTEQNALAYAVLSWSATQIQNVPLKNWLGQPILRRGQPVMQKKSVTILNKSTIPSNYLNP